MCIILLSSASTSIEKHILSASQCKREMKHGADTFLVMVSSVVAESVPATETDPVDANVHADVTPLSIGIDATRHEFVDIFREPSGLPPDRGIEHVIPLEDNSQPPFKRMYRLSPAELVEIKRQVTELLQKQLIKQLIELSVSPFGAPILFVLKKTGELQTVIDYRALNKMTVKNRYPLPRIDDLFDKLQGSQFFTSLDAASGFHQILLQESDRPKTAFRTPFGHYQFCVLPFGLTNAPATFQAAMNKVFNPNKYEADGTINPLSELSDFVLVFIDDILIFSKSAEEHLKHVRKVMQVLREHTILIKASKCTWGQEELPYLGHIVSKDGIKVDPKKVQAVSDWPEPQNLTELQQFLGLTNFFRKYVQG